MTRRASGWLATNAQALLGLSVLWCSLGSSAGQNASSEYAVLARTWSGAGWPESTQAGASYIYRPTDSLTYDECLPRTGRPSPCPAEMLTLVLANEPPAGSEPGLLNFTMMIHGDVFTSSPNSNNYYGMPEACRYVHNHTVEARFNVSSGVVSFTILKTTSDFLQCGMELTGSGDDVQTAPGERCQLVGGSPSCHTNLNGLMFQGIFTLKDSSEGTGFKFPDGSLNGLDVTASYLMEITLAFPYKHAGIGSWSDFATQFNSQIQVQQVAAQAQVSAQMTDEQQQVFKYTLAPISPYPYRPYAWFRDRQPYILEVNPPFGPEEGGPVVTVRGVEFPEADANFQNASLVLYHDSTNEGGQERECCETVRISETEMTCVLPRVSCRNEKTEVNNCPKPGADYVNQSIKLAIRPNVVGFDGLALAGDLDDFLSYEGTWVLEDNDIYGGQYVIPADRIPGEAHLLQQAQDRAFSDHCCPVCTQDMLDTDRSQCEIVITRESNSVYKVTIPPFMNPGDPSTPAVSGACDAATNYVNKTLTLAIETSTDNEFPSASPLSITNCMDMTGACSEANRERVSIRTFCKQLVWSNGEINSFIPAGETVERHEWITSGSCDRRMRCVAGPCMWTTLANRDEVFQRRSSSPKLTLKVDYRNPNFQPQGFLQSLAPLIDSEDSRRLQILDFTTNTGAMVAATTQETFVRSEPALCIPDPGDSTASPPRASQTSCSSFLLSIYIVSGGPTEGSAANVPQNNLTERAGAQTGDPDFRRLNLLELCIDLSDDPASVTEGVLEDCIKIQYPGFLQFEIQPGTGKDRRVKEEVWAFASLGVTRTGGTDLGVTVDYGTFESNDPTILTDPLLDGMETPVVNVAKGLGEDFYSKNGQLRWTPGDAGTKYIIVPIYDDDEPELFETFKVRISGVVNASMSFFSETATVTIVGGPLNDTPTPRYSENMQRIIGAVCGAATTIPCALFAARLIRSLRRGKDTKKRKQGAGEHSEEQK